MHDSSLSSRRFIAEPLATLVVILIALFCVPVAAQQPESRQALFGELHLHTGFSLDAVLLSGTTLTPDDAYRYGKGEMITYRGHAIQRREPLDFMAVTDHGENLGLGLPLIDPSAPAGKSELGQRLRQGLPVGPDLLRHLSTSRDPIAGVDARSIARSAWQAEIEAAKRHYQPGKFTTFVAYEWSSMPQLINLHRNVIFRGTDVPAPFTQIDSERPEDLWSYLERNRRRGVEALAIPHNSNFSNGLMFDWLDSDGKPISKNYALRRSMNEPLVEISQTKGVSETHPVLSPNDEFAGFGIDNEWVGHAESAKIHGNYVREALGRGLVIAGRVGVNPFAYGFVGATDFHTGISDTDENRFVSAFETLYTMDRDRATKLLGLGSGPKPSAEDVADLSNSALLQSSGSLTGVWADSNTREAVYDALRRKEAFATSGTRIKVRMFAGWSFAADLISSTDWLRSAYATGVPMGSDLLPSLRPSGAPRFILAAEMDPSAARLERLQVVKIWQDGSDCRERVFDVAVAHSVPPGNTVLGVSQFLEYWMDPEFDPARRAAYYVRVLEVPALRWSTLLAARFNLPAPLGAPATIQERAWSSPIWYVPATRQQ